MNHGRTISLGSALAVPIAVLALAGCGGSDNHSATSSTPSATKGRAAPIQVRDSNLGRILVGRQGRTLYLFEPDAGHSSTCAASCAYAWPPVTTSARPTAGAGASQADLGTIRRPDGSTEVTYNGHPLYYYAGDEHPGQTNGQGLNQFSGAWYAISPAGNKIDNS